MYFQLLSFLTLVWDLNMAHLKPQYKGRMQRFMSQKFGSLVSSKKLLLF